MCPGSVQWLTKPELLASMLSIRCCSDVTLKSRTKQVFSKRFSFALQLLPSIDTSMADSGQCKTYSMTFVESSAMGQGKVFLFLPGINIKNMSGNKQGLEPLYSSRTSFLLNAYV